MYIRSQDKRFLLNFDTGRIYADCFRVYYQARPTGGQFLLGSYEDEEEAISIVEDIESLVSSTIKNVYPMPESRKK